VIVAPDIDQGATKRQKQNDEQKEASLIKVLDERLKLQFDDLKKERNQDFDQEEASSLIFLIKEKLYVHFKRLEADQQVRRIPKTMHIYMIDPKKSPSIPTLPPSDPTLPLSAPTLPPPDPTLPAFSPTDSYWIENVQPVRFDDCESRGILYRP